MDTQRTDDTAREGIGTVAILSEELVAIRILANATRSALIANDYAVAERLAQMLAAANERAQQLLRTAMMQ